MNDLIVYITSIAFFMLLFWIAETKRRENSFFMELIEVFICVFAIFLFIYIVSGGI